MRKYITLTLITWNMVFFAQQCVIKPDVSLYKQFRKHVIEKEDVSSLDRLENEFFEYVHPILKKYNPDKKIYLDKDGFFAYVFCNYPDHMTAPEVVDQLKKSRAAITMSKEIILNFWIISLLMVIVGF